MGWAGADEKERGLGLTGCVGLVCMETEKDGGSGGNREDGEVSGLVSTWRFLKVPEGATAVLGGGT